MAFSPVFHLLTLVALALTTFAALTPDQDQFYIPPAGFASQAPGAILKSRKVATSFLGLIPTLNVQSYQLLYRTTAVNGSAIAAVTTIFKPTNGSNLKHDRFLSFHTAYDGSSTICDPSYSYQLSSSQVDLTTSLEFLLLEAFLSDGYIVSSPDYEGPDAAFTAGRLAGMVTLDSMRAVTNFNKTLGLNTKSPKIVGYGYSGGSVASGWGASLHNSYAPELSISGWATGGTIANLTGTALYLDDKLFSGYLPAAVDGLNKPSSYAAQINPVIESIVTPYGQSKLDFANQNCLADLFNFAEMSLLSTKVQSLGDQLYYQPDIAAVINNQIMGVNSDETPTPPVYLYHASSDEIIPYSNASTLVDSWCADGASVEFVTFANGGHITTEILGFVGAYQFVERAFAGTATTSGCTRSTSLNDTLDPLALGTSLEPILVELIDALADLGDEDSNVIANLNVLNGTTLQT